MEKDKPKFRPDPRLRLLDHVRQFQRYHHYAYRTEQTYCDWIVRYVKFHGAKKHPREMGKAELEALLTHLATHGRVSARSLSNITFTPRMRYILLAILSTGIISDIIVLSFFFHQQYVQFAFDIAFGNGPSCFVVDIQGYHSKNRRPVRLDVTQSNLSSRRVG